MEAKSLLGGWYHQDILSLGGSGRFSANQGEASLKLSGKNKEKTRKPDIRIKKVAPIKYGKECSPMDHYGRTFFAILGLSASFFTCFPIVRKWQKKKLAQDKLRMVSEALVEAELRVVRYEERHDRILGQICSHYLVNQDMEEALARARGAMNDAQEFAVILRNLQIEILSSFPGEDATAFDFLFRRSRKSRNNSSTEEQRG